jgi:hypothetical protein
MDIRGINATIDLVQKVIKLGKQATNLEYEEALLAARESLFDLREQNLRVKEDKEKLQAKIKSLESKAKIHPEKGHEWIYVEADEDESRRYCPHCYYSDDRLIPLNKPYARHGSGIIERQCPKCIKSFE